MFKVGIGYDSHKLVAGRKLILGGVEIPYEKGLFGHSDADVLIHAIIDSLLGAVGIGDIGIYFPDTDPKYKNISSLKMLKCVLNMLNSKGYKILNIDSTVIIEKPKLKPHIPKMIEKLKDIGLDKINIKAKTNEGMGFIGRNEGIAAIVVSIITQGGIIDESSSN